MFRVSDLFNPYSWHARHFLGFLETVVIQVDSSFVSCLLTLDPERAVCVWDIYGYCMEMFKSSLSVYRVRLRPLSHRKVPGKNICTELLAFPSLKIDRQTHIGSYFVSS